MTLPPWVEAMYLRHLGWALRDLHGPPLTDVEALQRQRDYSVLLAWEWFDGGEGVAYLAAQLAARRYERKRPHPYINQTAIKGTHL